MCEPNIELPQTLGIEIQNIDPGTFDKDQGFEQREISKHSFDLGSRQPHAKGKIQGLEIRAVESRETRQTKTSGKTRPAQYRKGCHGLGQFGVVENEFFQTRIQNTANSRNITVPKSGALLEGQRLEVGRVLQQKGHSGSYRIPREGQALQVSDPKGMGAPITECAAVQRNGLERQSRRTIVENINQIVAHRCQSLQIQDAHVVEPVHQLLQFLLWSHVHFEIFLLWLFGRRTGWY